MAPNLVAFERWFASKQFSVDDESGPLCHLVVQSHRGRVGLMGLPIHSFRS
jgi:hypothetical protein